MSNTAKHIDIENHTHYFFDDIINLKNFVPNNIKIDKRSSKKYFYLLYWTCDNQTFEIYKNQ